MESTRDLLPSRAPRRQASCEKLPIVHKGIEDNVGGWELHSGELPNMELGILDHHFSSLVGRRRLIALASVDSCVLAAFLAVLSSHLKLLRI